MKIKLAFLVLLSLFLVPGCHADSQERKDRAAVNLQQQQYAARQPVPVFNYSRERDLAIQLYQIRNSKVDTHAVWRSQSGLILGDCPCLGYPLPYATSLTNGLQRDGWAEGAVVIEQAEPNGLFPAKNTNATWVPCVGEGGLIEPHYVEAFVDVYPYPVKVNRQTGEVARVGASKVRLQVGAGN